MPFTSDSALRWLWILGSNEAAVETFTGHPDLHGSVVDVDRAGDLGRSRPKRCPMAPAT